MKHICLFNGDMSLGGGTERITQVLANALAESGDYKITVLDKVNTQGGSYYPLNDGINFATLDGKSVLGWIWSLWRFVTKNKVDILIDVDVMLGIFALPVKIMRPWMKLINWEMFNLRNDIGTKNSARIRKLALWLSSYYVTQSKGDMEAFLAEMPVHCPITYIYNPCPANPDYKDYDVNSKTIVTAGHFFYTKGYDLAVEVARLVFQRHPDWRWEFYGDGVRFEDVKKKITEYHLENNVILCGRTKDITAAYKRASMYVMTSRTEGFGLVLTEAKACNLPTLAFDIDFGPREIIEDGISGFLVKDFNVSELADKICELIDNPEKRICFAQKAQDNLGKFSLGQFVQAWKTILK